AALVLGRRLARPLERLTASARRLGEGDFAARAPRSAVPEIDSVGRALDTTAERLDALVSREREFTADASHQLRTPLAALRIELESMELAGNAPPPVGAALEQAARLEQTVETLLAVRRESGGNAEADVTPLLDEVEARWHGPLAADARPLRMHVRDTPVHVRASPSVVREILEVLVDNSARHGAGAVSVSVRAIGDAIAVEVADEGRGFADPAAAFIRGAAHANGHGIGLALARSLAESQGGSLEVTHAGPKPVVRLLVSRAPAAG
ncbi:MAG TPA: HAMP domain-containing sensor histidine kinase, partial [Thermoleophilaceae bacterium]|nr:HAMP domain-containing sensor histidine kinase [Thermoleophilaceae bacterium]